MAASAEIPGPPADRASLSGQLSLPLQLPVPVPVPSPVAEPALSTGHAPAAERVPTASPPPGRVPGSKPPPAAALLVAGRQSRRLRRLADYARLLRLNRPIGIWLLLWPALWALWVASAGHPGGRLIGIFIAGTVCMRSAGCVINDLADRNIDPHVRRTRDRPLAARRVSPYEALLLFGLLIGAAFLLVLQLNDLTVHLSLVGAALTLSYPLLKRFFPLPQLYLGLAFGWAIPMAFAAQQGSVPRVGWLMLLAAVLWAGVYDTIYAMVDRDDDLRIGVRSSAILFGDLDRLMIAAMQLMVLLALLLVGRSQNLGAIYYAGLSVGAASFIRQQWLIRRRERAACLRAFQDNNYFGIAVLAGLILEFASHR